VTAVATSACVARLRSVGSPETDAGGIAQGPDDHYHPHAWINPPHDLLALRRGRRPPGTLLVNRPRLSAVRRSPSCSSIERALTRRPASARTLQLETSRLICQILASELISIGRQPVLIAATRCYLIQML
jgi:hypothetical protein